MINLMLKINIIKLKMNVWSNVKYYLNYFDLNRGDNKIINYFSSNENYKAIKELTNEGYFQFE